MKSYRHIDQIFEKIFDVRIYEIVRELSRNINEMLDPPHYLVMPPNHEQTHTFHIAT